ncbi:hypothetical protein HDIA_2257 [Hartmannibacter diazotrophicus]|uniref:Uncharacterized protein n=1 Tax=Hartmannibacter diazotrophicus TaxID=1482074 RepID=A0A2C9D6M4_9HYPH|nr:hypothetical protein [Hartmannibacter diazotrophicus]SON55798.1 hypothetical protein HDIA_2257 [Hartmannibacter diazotrophicus]
MPNVERALQMAIRYGGIDGDRHKAWVIDQMVRALTDCPMVEKSALDVNDNPYNYEEQGESEAYMKLVADACDGEDGPQTYPWDCGIKP